MKIRGGFVSNSSSSSFVAIVTAEAFKKLESELSILQLACLYGVGPYHKSVLGKDCMVYESTHGNYSTAEEISETVILDEIKRISKERGEELEDDTEIDSTIIDDTMCEVEDKMMKLVETSDAFTYGMDF